MAERTSNAGDDDPQVVTFLLLLCYLREIHERRGVSPPVSRHEPAGSRRAARQSRKVQATDCAAGQAIEPRFRCRMVDVCVERQREPYVNVGEMHLRSSRVSAIRAPVKSTLPG